MTNWYFYLIFPRKQALTFHANCLLRRQFAWTVKACFLRINKKKKSKCRLLKFLPSMLSIKSPSDTLVTLLMLFVQGRLYWLENSSSYWKWMSKMRKTLLPILKPWCMDSFKFYWIYPNTQTEMFEQTLLTRWDCILIMVCNVCLCSSTL